MSTLVRRIEELWDELVCAIRGHKWRRFRSSMMAPGANFDICTRCGRVTDPQ